MARAPAPPAKPHRISVHHHLMPPGLAKRMKAAKIGNPVQLAWTVQQSLDDMARWWGCQQAPGYVGRAGAPIAFLSLSIPGVTFLPRDEARAAARESNDYA